MKITIECDCGNRVVMEAQTGKYIQSRDYLYSKQFRYGKPVIETGKFKEISIQCDRCKSWVSLGTD